MREEDEEEEEEPSSFCSTSFLPKVGDFNLCHHLMAL